MKLLILKVKITLIMRFQNIVASNNGEKIVYRTNEMKLLVALAHSKLVALAAFDWKV